MKKIIILFISVITLQQAKAQSFDKNSLVLSADYGFNYYSLSQQVSHFNVANSLYNNTSAATSFSWNFSAEYGLFKWLGVGVLIKLDNYTTKTDSTTGVRGTAAGFETAGTLNIHLIRATNFNLLIGADAGYSHLTYNTNDGFNDQVYGNGSWLDVHATARFYFGRFGVNFTAYIPALNYSSFISTSSNWQSGEDVLAAWKGTGAGLNVGIQYRILN
jgi:hypothetical protein